MEREARKIRGETEEGVRLRVVLGGYVEKVCLCECSLIEAKCSEFR